jgi:hypothetical protein
VFQNLSDAERAVFGVGELRTRLDIQLLAKHAGAGSTKVLKQALSSGFRAAPSGRSRRMPEWLQGLVQSGLTIIALIVIIMLLAALFMIIFGIATGIDDRIQE